jgi:ectoine utilization protein EutC
MAVEIFYEPEIRKSVTLREAIDAMEGAFVAYAQKAATVPSVIHLDIPAERGEIHIKAAHMHAAPEYVVKIAAGFYNNRQHGLPVGSGMMLVFDAKTGFPQAILIDNACLTDIRTAAAGGLAAKYMARKKIDRVGIIGAGVQGRLQLEALACVRDFKTVVLYDHHTTNVAKYREEMSDRISVEMIAANSPEDAVRDCQVIITATPARQPIVKAEWLSPGAHITALGSDGPDKQELEVGVLRRADRIIADSIQQCAKFGEIHHALEAGVLKENDVDGELGEVVLGKIPGRSSEDEITVCDLTGVGVQDAAIAALAYKKLTTKTQSRKAAQES